MSKLFEKSFARNFIKIIFATLIVSGCGGGGSSSSPVDTSSSGSETSSSSSSSSSSGTSALTINGTPATTITVGQAYSFTPTVLNGTSLGFTINNKPAWATFNTTIGTLSGTPTNSAIGTYSNILITASDGANSVTLPSFSITVVPITNVVVITWTIPTENTDGSLLTNLAGYNVYYGTDPDTLTQIVDINNPTLTTYTINNLPSGTYYFAVTAYNSQGVASANSIIVSASF